MQTLELGLILIVAGYIGFNRLIHKKLNRYYVIGLLLIVLAIQLVFEGYRWQMIPAYLLWVTDLINAFIQPGGKSSVMVRVSKAADFVVLLVLSVILPMILPVFELPQPTGPYSVVQGTYTLNLTGSCHYSPYNRSKKRNDQSMVSI